MYINNFPLNFPPALECSISKGLEEMRMYLRRVIHCLGPIVLGLNVVLKSYGLTNHALCSFHSWSGFASLTWIIHHVTIRHMLMDMGIYVQ